MSFAHPGSGPDTDADTAAGYPYPFDFPSHTLPEQQKKCSVRGCAAPLAPDATTKMCEACRGKHRRYATTKRAKRKQEKAAMTGQGIAIASVEQLPGEGAWMPTQGHSGEENEDPQGSDAATTKRLKHLLPKNNTPLHPDSQPANTLHPPLQAASNESDRWPDVSLGPSTWDAYREHLSRANSSSELAGALTYPNAHQYWGQTGFYGYAQGPAVDPALGLVPPPAEEDEEDEDSGDEEPAQESAHEQGENGVADFGSRRCSVRGCKTMLESSHPYKMCQPCQVRYRGYGRTKRKKWRTEREAFRRELEQLREAEEARRAAEGLPSLRDNPDELAAWEHSLTSEHGVIPPALAAIIASSLTAENEHEHEHEPSLDPDANEPSTSRNASPTPARMCTVSHCRVVLVPGYAYKRCEQHRLQNRHHSRLKRVRELAERERERLATQAHTDSSASMPSKYGLDGLDSIGIGMGTPSMMSAGKEHELVEEMFEQDLQKKVKAKLRKVFDEGGWAKEDYGPSGKKRRPKRTAQPEQIQKEPRRGKSRRKRSQHEPDEEDEDGPSIVYTQEELSGTIRVFSEKMTAIGEAHIVDDDTFDAAEQQQPHNPAWHDIDDFSLHLHSLMQESTGDGTTLGGGLMVWNSRPPGQEGQMSQSLLVHPEELGSPQELTFALPEMLPVMDAPEEREPSLVPAREESHEESPASPPIQSLELMEPVNVELEPTPFVLDSAQHEQALPPIEEPSMFCPPPSAEVGLAQQDTPPTFTLPNTYSLYPPPPPPPPPPPASTLPDVAPGLMVTPSPAPQRRWPSASVASRAAALQTQVNRGAERQADDGTLRMRMLVPKPAAPTFVVTPSTPVVLPPAPGHGRGTRRGGGPGSRGGKRGRGRGRTSKSTDVGRGGSSTPANASQTQSPATASATSAPIPDEQVPSTPSPPPMSPLPPAPPMQSASPSPAPDPAPPGGPASAHTPPSAPVEVPAPAPAPAPSSPAPTEQHREQPSAAHGSVPPPQGYPPYPYYMPYGYGWPPYPYGYPYSYPGMPPPPSNGHAHHPPPFHTSGSQTQTPTVQSQARATSAHSAGSSARSGSLNGREPTVAPVGYPPPGYYPPYPPGYEGYASYYGMYSSPPAPGAGQSPSQGGLFPYGPPPHSHPPLGGPAPAPAPAPALAPAPAPAQTPAGSTGPPVASAPSSGSANAPASGSTSTIEGGTQKSKTGSVYHYYSPEQAINKKKRRKPLNDEELEQVKEYYRNRARAATQTRVISQGNGGGGGGDTHDPPNGTATSSRQCASKSCHRTISGPGLLCEKCKAKVKKHSARTKQRLRLEPKKAVIVSSA